MTPPAHARPPRGACLSTSRGPWSSLDCAGGLLALPVLMGVAVGIHYGLRFDDSPPGMPAFAAWQPGGMLWWQAMASSILFFTLATLLGGFITLYLLSWGAGSFLASGLLPDADGGSSMLAALLAGAITAMIVFGIGGLWACRIRKRCSSRRRRQIWASVGLACGCLPIVSTLLFYYLIFLPGQPPRPETLPPAAFPR